MEITNEIKAKLFAQYLGNKYKVNRFNDTIFEKMTIRSFSDYQVTVPSLEFERINWHEEILRDKGYQAMSSEIILILKPLSSITDEDAIEVGKLVGIWSEKEIEEMQPLEKETIKLLIRYGENYSKVVGSKNDLGIGFLDFGGSSRKLFLAHQFLQSKGYDLPHYLLGGKTLFESGLAIYEK